MTLNFKTAALGVAALGIVLGVAFGSGVAYGRGDPKTVESGLTQQQIQSLLGISGASAAGAQTTPSAGGQRQGTGATGAAAGAGQTVGRVTAVSGSTVTIQTATGTQRVNLATSTSINKTTVGAIADIKEGQTILATGSRKEDGSFDAAALSQLPAELSNVFGGASGTPTPSGAR